MRLLLDTHTLIWFAEDSPQMPDYTKTVLEDGQHEKWVSVASVWEIAIKYRLGKLALAEPPEEYLPYIIKGGGISILPVLFEHAVYVSKLALHHKDPFDRLLVAQSLLESMPLVSADAMLDAYGITRYWEAR